MYFSVFSLFFSPFDFNSFFWGVWSRSSHQSPIVLTEYVCESHRRTDSLPALDQVHSEGSSFHFSVISFLPRSYKCKYILIKFGSIYRVCIHVCTAPTIVVGGKRFTNLLWFWINPQKFIIWTVWCTEIRFGIGIEVVALNHIWIKSFGG